MTELVPCPSCKTPTSQALLSEAAWYPYWQRADGGCPACVQHNLLATLLNEGPEAFHASVGAAWSVDHKGAYAALPTPLRLHADPRVQGRGVTIAFLDSGFYPHPDLVCPANRIRAWVDAGSAHIQAIEFEKEITPQWPGWNAAEGWQWHGMMTSSVAAGNGFQSHGLFAGLASEAHVVLIQVREADGRITNESITRGLRWVAEHRERLGIRVVSMSVSGEMVEPLLGNPVDSAVEELVERGISVVAAAGNDGVRRLIPPATAPLALTVGGTDDHNAFTEEEVELWHSNYGEASNFTPKPELVAPSIWLATPLLPGSKEAQKAEDLFTRIGKGREDLGELIQKLKLITPHYQHSDGTSFAAPIVASTVACMLEANPALTPILIRQILTSTAHPVSGAPKEHQGAGAVHPGRAVAAALAEHHHAESLIKVTPSVTPAGVVFLLHDHGVKSLRVFGSWNNWVQPGLAARAREQGLWLTRPLRLAKGQYAYKFLVNETDWQDDPANPQKVSDGHGGLNSSFVVK